MRGPVAVLVLLSGVALAQEVQPQYSDEAKTAGLEGRVVVSAVISPDGTLADFSIVQPLGLGLDEQAIEALRQVRLPDSYPPGVRSVFPIDFTLPSTGPRWHLVRITFKTPPGASRPTFASANYPPGAGLTVAAYEEARILSAIKRAAYATIAFDIGEQGEPGNFSVVDESANIWGPEAAALVRNWRFHPGMRNGEPIKTSCEVALIWGSTLAAQLGSALSPSSPGTPRPQPIVENVTQPQPEYTGAARNAGIEGVVWIDVIVDQTGVPRNPTVTLGLDGASGAGLTQQAVNAVRAWRFPPALPSEAVASRKATVRIEFKLAGVRSTIFWQGK